ncbi:hypothetical protein LshimejAT787_1203070 [Lyophyllum shimeji]|uniref:Protein kinase domain-containing protein n=1 Tax=Lyophyllum shimeji TaxID=47721 RepID=A0A9P3PWG5_LYOSH|nr:hypothetical protein LshimejAT787_1203070 [Lyophyllum shimeji]
MMQTSTAQGTPDLSDCLSAARGGASSERVAIKVLRGGITSKPAGKDKLKKAVERHSAIWVLFQHENIPRFYGVAYKGFTPASDVFAFAMTTIEIFNGAPPFIDMKNDSSVIFASFLQYWRQATQDPPLHRGSTHSP